jgi:16S rRNA (guanine527-N7)-methyltransferase
VKHDPKASEFVRQALSLGVRLDTSQAGRVLAYEGLLRERAIPAGLVSVDDAPRLRERHILDCLRAATEVRSLDRLALDLGSGAGLPGMVVAIACPGLRVRLVDSRRRRVAFLELAVADLELANVQVLQARVEGLDAEADLCFARAFAPLEETWSLASGLLAPGGRLVYFAGAGFDAASVREPVDVRPAPPVLESAGPLVIMAR